jgi:hypothetical protein
MSDQRHPLISRSLHCGCGYEWRDWEPFNVPIETWVAHLRELACPACGAGRGTFLGKTLRNGHREDGGCDARGARTMTTSATADVTGPERTSAARAFPEPGHEHRRPGDC